MHVFKYFSRAKSGRANIMACPLGAKSGPAAAQCPPCPIGSAVSDYIAGRLCLSD